VASAEAVEAPTVEDLEAGSAVVVEVATVAAVVEVRAEGSGAAVEADVVADAI
ncbi:hypothetical protein BGZ82_000806, partial [Podila clonocystis]